MHGYSNTDDIMNVSSTYFNSANSLELYQANLLMPSV